MDKPSKNQVEFVKNLIDNDETHKLGNFHDYKYKPNIAIKEVIQYALQVQLDIFNGKLLVINPLEKSKYSVVIPALPEEDK